MSRSQGRSNPNLLRRCGIRVRIGWRVAAFSLLLAWLHAPAAAQNLHVRGEISAAGGFATGEGLSLYSNVGSAAPSGTARQDRYRIDSGFLAVFDRIEAFAGLSHIPARPALEGKAMTVSVTLDSTVRIDSAAVFYRSGGDVDFAEAKMSESEPGLLVATIPPGAVTSAGLAYHIELRDGAGRAARIPDVAEYGVNVRVEEPGLLWTEGLPGGSEQDAYRLFSVPLILDEPDPRAAFEDELGPYEPRNWRLFELLFTQQIREYPETRPFSPGAAFWLISREERPSIVVGTGVSILPTETYSMPLHPGWNLVGNPFNFPIPAAQVQLQDGGPAAIRSYDGSWNDPINDAVESLDPFSGYAVFNPSAAVQTLNFDPTPAEEAPFGKHSSASRQAELDWWLHVLVRSGGALDADNVLGVSDAAQDAPDHLDFPEPPPIGDFVSAYFNLAASRMSNAAYSTDIRSASPDGATWELELVSTTRDPVRLWFNGLDSVPEAYDVLLVDDVANIVHDVRASPSYNLADIGSRSARALKLVVGKASFAAEQVKTLHDVPSTVELLPAFPNPFASSTTIRYGLPEPSYVSMRLFSIAGQLIKELENGQRSKGRHSIVLDAASVEGGLANGVYLLELRAGGHRRTALITSIQ